MATISNWFTYWNAKNVMRGYLKFNWVRLLGWAQRTHAPSQSNFYRPQRSCGQAYVFTRVCDSVHRGGLRADPPGPGRHPPSRQNPPRTRQTPLGRENPPGPGRTPRTRQNPWQGEPAPPPGTRQTPPPGRENPPSRTRQTHPPWDQADPPSRENPPTRQNPPGTSQTPPHRRTSPGRENPPPPAGAGRPPRREEDCSMRSMSGRYASYWNAFLSFSFLCSCRQKYPKY